MSLEPFIKSNDIRRSINFYTKILDFELEIEPDSDPQSFMSNYASLKRGHCRVHLSAHSHDGAFGSLIYVRVTDVEQRFSIFVANGLNDAEKNFGGSIIIPLVEQSWGMKEFSIHDPDGNKMTFGQSVNRKI